MSSAKQLRGSSAFAKGIAAERAACLHLEKSGYEVLQTRYLSEAGEIDIIAMAQNCLIFIEVKARSTSEQAIYSINKRQQLRIIAAAECYLAANFTQFQNHDVRFDVIVQATNGELQHIENAFDVSY